MSWRAMGTRITHMRRTHQAPGLRAPAGAVRPLMKKTPAIPTTTPIPTRLHTSGAVSLHRFSRPARGIPIQLRQLA